MEASLPVLLGGIGAGWLISGGALAVNRRLGLALASLMGLGVSLYLGVQKLAGEGSVCSVDETFNCDVVNQSGFSEIAGIPIAFLGSGFYAAVLAVSIAGLLKPKTYGKAGSFVLVGGVISVLYSLFLAWASTTIGAWCLFCIAMYGVNALLLAGGWLTRAPGGLSAAFADKEDRSVGTMVAAGLVVFVGAMAWYNSQSGFTPTDMASTGADGEQDLSKYAQLMTETEGPLALDGTEPVLGDPTAPYTVVEFADYECPGCAATKPLVDELVARNPNVKVYFKHYPLSNICNPSIGRTFHENACQAAAAAECANQQGRFWDLSHLLFKNQNSLDRDGLLFMAKQVGLDGAAFTTCLDDPATMAAVEADVAAGNRVGVHGTPSLYLKGTHGDRWVLSQAGPEGIELLVRAHADGKELPEPMPVEAHEH